MASSLQFQMLIQILVVGQLLHQMDNQLLSITHVPVQLELGFTISLYIGVSHHLTLLRIKKRSTFKSVHYLQHVLRQLFLQR